MNLQGRNLQQGLTEGLTGDDVRLLHAELAQPNLVVPDEGRARAVFGPATVAVVQQFQKQHAIPITGVVDSAAPAAINAAMNAQFRPTSTASGGVYSALSADAGGLKIPPDNAGIFQLTVLPT
jgi:peptidoglycan hydrolase-like protein with peptidoglycan-binding domain